MLYASKSGTRISSSLNVTETGKRKLKVFRLKKLNRANLNVKNTIYKTGDLNKEIDSSINFRNMPQVKRFYYRNIKRHLK